MRYIFLMIIAMTWIALMSSVKPTTTPRQALPRYVVYVDFSKSGLCLCCDTVTIMRIVRRAFAPFPALRITTNDAEPMAAAAYVYKQPVIVTALMSSGSDGGAGNAYIGSFWWGKGSSIPAYVYSNKMTVPRTAATIIHEIGHTIGLRHQSEWSADCKLTSQYVWGAWMGLSDSTGRWITGKTNEGCNVSQNDSLILAMTLR
jgi:hypothetical protein